MGAVGIVIAGTYLARAGDAIAAGTKLGGVWIGSVLVAAATSLPEIGTDIAAVRRDAIDLALGDLFGSSMANMLIVAIISLSPPGREIFRRVAYDHALFAALALVMTAVACIALLTPHSSTVLGLGWGSLALLAIYLSGSRAIAHHSPMARAAESSAEMSAPAAEEAAHDGPATSLRRAIVVFVLAALVILLIAPVFARTAHLLAERTGIGQTFMGTWLVGLTTSLPELVTSFTAVRMGAFDLAIGNLFGSNAFNMAVFGMLDVVSPAGPVLAIASDAHVLAALVAMAMMAMATAALVYRSQRVRRRYASMGALMIVAYGAGLALILRASMVS